MPIVLYHGAPACTTWARILPGVDANRRERLPSVGVRYDLPRVSAATVDWSVRVPFLAQDPLSAPQPERS